MQAAKGGKQSVVSCPTVTLRNHNNGQHGKIPISVQAPNSTKPGGKEKPSKKQQTEDFKFV